MPPRKKMTMTQAHKTALALGRSQAKAVRDYLDALDQNRPKRGRKRTADSVKRRLTTVESELRSASSVKRVELLQERRDLADELDAMSLTRNLDSVEKGFVRAARGYSERKGISYATWREAGVPADVLKRAGIGRGS
jgi:hypothetical protein